ncbi:hypothetical protein [Dactylosporangium salmoneum]|uniref:Uncharacterized protein n=1 Tax=Dactylosporangium salmoneum TaxID=53361 RepID=A0ABP5U8L7_9ACTN
MLSIAAIAFTLGLLLPRGAEAVATAIGFVVVASTAGPSGLTRHPEHSRAARRRS